MFATLTSLRGSSILRLAAFVASILCGGCDWSLTGTHPAPTRDAGCQRTVIELYPGGRLPDSIDVVCHPLPAAK